MTFLSSRVARVGVLCALVFLPASLSFGSFASIDHTYGPESDLAAQGGFFTQAGGTRLGSWSLSTSVAGTDFSNDYFFGGSQGVQYTMLNPVFGSPDTNEMVFSLASLQSQVPQILLRQSPYFQDPDQWNGGNISTDIAQFEVRWTGGGQAVVSDPAGQFFLDVPQTQAIDSTTTVPSGTTFTFTDFQIFNSDDEWEIRLPPGVSSVEVDWRSSHPTPGSDLTREWINFDVDFIATPVPEPSGTLLLTLGLISLVRRRGSHVRRRGRK